MGEKIRDLKPKLSPRLLQARLCSDDNHYNVKENTLELLIEKDLKKWVTQATGNFRAITKASVVLIITGVLDRMRIKYGDRGYRYVLMEAGHMAQNILLLATELGLGSLPIGGYIDNKVCELLDICLVREVPLYMIAVGGYEG